MRTACLAGLLLLLSPSAFSAEDGTLRDAPAPFAAPFGAAGAAGAFLRPGPAALAPKALPPFMSYRGARWTCQGDASETGRSTRACLRGASAWSSLAQKACRGRCARVRDADGLVTQTCGVASFTVEKPCP